MADYTGKIIEQFQEAAKAYTESLLIPQQIEQSFEGTSFHEKIAALTAFIQELNQHFYDEGVFISLGLNLPDDGTNSYFLCVTRENDAAIPLIKITPALRVASQIQLTAIEPYDYILDGLGELFMTLPEIAINFMDVNDIVEYHRAIQARQEHNIAPSGSPVQDEHVTRQGETMRCGDVPESTRSATEYDENDDDTHLAL